MKIHPIVRCVSQLAASIHSGHFPACHPCLSRGIHRGRSQIARWSESLGYLADGSLECLGRKLTGDGMVSHCVELDWALTLGLYCFFPDELCDFDYIVIL